MFNRVGFYQDLTDAFQCLWYWKYRTLLSALGIAIGTTALIVMMSISEGARLRAEATIKQLGVDTIRLESRAKVVIEINQNQNLATGITTQDVNRLATHNKGLQVGVYYHQPAQSIIHNNEVTVADVIFVNADWLASENLTLASGRGLNSLDQARLNQVCVVGSNFIRANNIKSNDVISWNNNSCQIVGVLLPTKKRVVEGSVIANMDINNLVILPVEFSPSKNKLTGITIKLHQNDSDVIKQHSKRLEELLRQHHVVKDYNVILPITLLEKAQEEQRLFNIIMGTIASLSLIVGGIGILNVMLAKVAEQTREIGIRKTMGATNTRIFQLFLLYSLMLALSGTAFGVVLGLLVALGVQWYANWPVAFSLFSLLIGPLFAVLSGLVFGLYPAKIASKLTPSIAIRHI